MQEECRSKIYSEDYLDYVVEFFPNEITLENSGNDGCYIQASNRFAVYYEEGESYDANRLAGIKMIPRCYGLISSEEVLESAGILQVRRQAGLNLLGQGVMIGFVDTGERVIILSSQ